jgi:hypothetical protein
MRKFTCMGILCFLLCSIVVKAQTVSIIETEKDANQKKTGNKEDILASYIQIAADNLTNDNKGIHLKLSWFALNGQDSITKYDNTNYLKTTWQRNGQFLLAGGLNKNGGFNSIQGGITYNVLNKRDITLYNFFDNFKKATTQIDSITKQERIKFDTTITAGVKLKITEVALSQFQLKLKDQLEAGLYQEVKDLPTDPALKILFQNAQNELNKSIDNERIVDIKLITNSLSEYLASLMLDRALNSYTTSFGKKALTFGFFVDASLLKQIIDAIDRDIKNDPLLKSNYNATGLTDINQKIIQQYKDLTEYRARQPIITFSYNYTHGWKGISSNHVAGFEGLWGLNKLGSKKTNQLTWSLTDTLTNKSASNLKSRNIAAIQAGLNTVLLMNKKTSLMELNIGIEDDVITHGAIGDESKNIFAFTSTFRARLINSPWLKLNLKYDVKGNVFGFLNFTYNIDSSK